MNTFLNQLIENQIEAPSLHMQKPIAETLNCHWLTDPDAWDKSKFSSEIVRFIEQTQGVNAFPNLILIGMLAQQIDLYVQCTRHIANHGLLEVYNKGATSGPSLYFSIADKALNRILQLMKELGITPAHRIGTVKLTSSDALEFESFMSGP
jgi:phage terminase small subunit